MYVVKDIFWLSSQIGVPSEPLFGVVSLELHELSLTFETPNLVQQSVKLFNSQVLNFVKF